MSLDTSLFTFAYDVVDEGARQVVDNAADRAGVGGLLMSVTYHDGRDLFPHARGPRVRYLEPGVTFFRPDRERYRGLAIQPRPASITLATDPLADLVEAATRRDLKVHGWTIFLHHDRIGDHEGFTPRNAFGDPIATDLCVSNPAVRAYARALAGDVASRGIETLLVEAIQFFPLEHGLHHERYFFPLGPRTRFLLGMCFCDACLAAARIGGADGAGLKRWAAAQIQRAFDADVDDPPRELSRDDVAAMAGGDMGAYLATREETVISLLAELRAITAATGVRLAFLEPSGAVKGYATGRPEGLPSPSVAWRLGLDLQRLADVTDELEMMSYAADPAWIAGDIAAYRSVLGQRAGLSAAVRPTPPDCDSVENLAEKLTLLSGAGVRRVDFYHYGMMRLEALDRIRAALSRATGTG